jgi:hypothetical protein
MTTATKHDWIPLPVPQIRYLAAGSWDVVSAPVVYHHRTTTDNVILPRLFLVDSLRSVRPGPSQDEKLEGREHDIDAPRAKEKFM